MDKFRLITLSTTCFISFLVFWITFVVTVAWDFCWSFEQFWFETFLPSTPYSWFIVLFSLIATWWLVELLLFIVTKAFKLFNISMLSITFVFLLAVTAIFYNFNIYYNWTKGVAAKESLVFYRDIDYSYSYRIDTRFPVYNSQGVPTKVPSFDSKHWLKFRNSMTCDKGIDFNLLSKDEWKELNEQYELLKREEFKKIGLDYDDPGKYGIVK